MNWGKWIVVAFTLFGAFIIYMVVGAFQQNIDLVTDDYYAQEIAFDSKMQKRANFKELDTKIKLEMVEGNVLFSFPQDVKLGEIHFYHPSRELFDKRYEIDLDENLQQTVSRKDLVAGRYRVNITWTQDNKEYLQQERIFVK